MSWSDAVSYAAAYDDGTNTDYRLITKSEALEILTNNDLLTQLGLTGTENFWTIEEIDVENAYVFAGILNNVHSEDKVIEHVALPVRKVNFYGLPLIDSEFGGGLVYDVVAATREVKIIPKWSDVIYPSEYDWDAAIHNYPSGIGDEYFMALPTRAEALKIFNNTWLTTLAGLPTDNDYWTREEVNEINAYYFDIALNEVGQDQKTALYYALPVRSETV